MSEGLRQAVLDAAGRADVRDAIAEVYADLQRQTDQRKPVCRMSGRCCRFDEFGHRLYVTTLELAAFVGSAREGNAGLGCRVVGEGCPFQAGLTCSVHAIRPFGCRVFFCDASSTQWQQEQYAAFHGRLRRLHEELGVPYFYVEWRAALAAMAD